jgi:hypothetical protein
MSNQMPPPDETNVQSTEDVQETDKAATVSVRNGALIIGLLILFSLGWYLLADRFTPFTTQARVQGYVVGVAPKVAGVVTQVWVKNNQAVEAAQPLFEIDPSQYRIALKLAQSDLGNARSQVDAGTAGVQSARADLRAALANELKAEKDYTRLARLHREDPGTISVRRLEVSQASLDQAHFSFEPDPGHVPGRRLCSATAIAVPGAAVCAAVHRCPGTADGRERAVWVDPGGTDHLGCRAASDSVIDPLSGISNIDRGSRPLFQ